MIKGIFYKEWIKIRKYFFSCFLLNIGFLVFYYLSLRHEFNMEHSELIWYQAFEIGRVYYSSLKWPVLISGIIIGAAQFALEMSFHRFRLSLHLPCPVETVVLGHILTGILLILFIAAVDLVSVFFITVQFFPAAGGISAVLTMFPWCYSGMIAYLGTCIVFLEPDFNKKLFYLVISSGFVRFFFLGHSYESYNRAFISIFLISILYFLSVFWPAYRYRLGRE